MCIQSASFSIISIKTFSEKKLKFSSDSNQFKKYRKQQYNRGKKLSQKVEYHVKLG